jgi:hypothetical protein
MVGSHGVLFLVKKVREPAGFKKEPEVRGKFFYWSGNKTGRLGQGNILGSRKILRPGIIGYVRVIDG